VNPPRHEQISLPTALSRELARRVLGLGVGIVVALAPFLGYVKVPGFEALFNLLPFQIRSEIVALSAFVVGLITVALQFYVAEEISRPALSKLFKRVLFAVVICFVSFVILLNAFTERVPAGNKEVSVMIGFSRTPDCKCKTPNNIECIRELSFNATAIASCWGSTSLKILKVLFILWYLALMSGFVVLVGLGLLQTAAKSQTAPPEVPPSKVRTPALQARPLAEWAYDLFLSYASKDKDFVAHLAEELRSQGLAIWWDQPKVGAGDSIGATIEEGLRKSRRFAVVLSPSSVSSDWVLDEVEAARALAPERKKQGLTSYLIPILYQDCVVPELLRGKRYADFRHSFQQAVDELLQRLLPTSEPPQSKPS